MTDRAPSSGTPETRRLPSPETPIRELPLRLAVIA